ncbi:MAG: YcxB family protein [Bacteroidaceae bacterium]|nr:YcxB family protein [Bacteroidaceae bacterium]
MKRLIIFKIVLFALCVIILEVHLALLIGLIFLFSFYHTRRAINKQAENYYNSNKKLQNQKVEYEFFEDYFKIKGQDFENNMKYADLHNIIETKENFYLMESVATAFIIIKANCNQELINHLSNIKVNIKYGKQSTSAQ